MLSGDPKPEIASGGLVGIGLEPDGFSIVHLVHESGETPRLDLCEFRPCDVEDLASSIVAAVHDHGLQGRKCVCVLPPNAYSLRLLEAPNVPEEELADAARWLIQDLIDFDPNEATIDTFALPADAYPGRARKVYVVAARNEVIKALIEIIGKSGLHLEAIDIRELAYRNLISVLPETPGATAMMQLGTKEGLLVLSGEQGMYMARSISTSTEQLDSSYYDQFSEGVNEVELEPADEQVPEDDPGLESLLLEVQRSLDYYESEFDKSPASRLVIAPAVNLEVPRVVDYLSGNLPTQVTSFEIDEIFACSKAVSSALYARCLPAFGGALRHDAPQEVDLRPKAKRRRESPLSFRRMVWAMGFNIVAVLIYYVLSAVQLPAMHEQVEQLRTEYETTSMWLEDLRSQEPTTAADPVLEAQVRGLEEDRIQKNRILMELADRQLGSTASFSGIFEGFARQPVDNLWLTEIHIAEEGRILSIQGKALRADLVPNLLQKLGNEPAFDGKSFRLFRMNADANEKVVNFNLDTRRASEVSP